MQPCATSKQKLGKLPFLLLSFPTLYPPSLSLSLLSWRYASVRIPNYYYCSCHWCTSTCFYFEDLHFTTKSFFPLHLKMFFINAGHNSLFGPCHHLHGIYSVVSVLMFFFSFGLTLILFISLGLKAWDCCAAVSNSLQMSIRLSKSSCLTLSDSACIWGICIPKTLKSRSIDISQLSLKIACFAQRPKRRNKLFNKFPTLPVSLYGTC